MPKKKQPQEPHLAPSATVSSVSPLAPTTTPCPLPISAPPPATVPAASPAGSPPVQSPAARQQGLNSPQRNPDGTFTKGHAKTGGIQRGQKQKLSLHIQTQMLEIITKEFDSDRFRTALQCVYNEDPVKYLSALQGYMRFCAPTLQSQSLEIQDSQTNRTIDDRLDDLMRQINQQQSTINNQ